MWSSPTTAPKLADAGISKDLSSRAQALAAVPAVEFEAELAAKRERERQDGERVTARLAKKGEKALKAKTAAQAEAERIADEANEGVDPLEALEASIKELEAENRLLRGQVEAMQADDQKAETLKWRTAAAVAERRQQEIQARLVDRERELQAQAKMIRRIAKAVGCDDPRNLACAVEAMARQKAAA